jgi:hypothetical protein
MARKQKDRQAGTTVTRSLRLDIPEREEEEEPATNKRQLAYIRHLAPGIKLTQGRLEDLGKWQASKIIDQIKEEKEQLELDVEQEAWERAERKARGETALGLTRKQISWIILIGLVLLWYLLS